MDEPATARRIVNEVKGIKRVTCDITSKPPRTIEWEWRWLLAAAIQPYLYSLCGDRLHSR